MKMIKMICPQCGGSLEVSEDAKQARCPFCNTGMLIDDEIKHIQFDNSMQAGYEFEQGRMRAQHDAAMRQRAIEQERIKAQQEYARKQKNLKWWILGWIFFFPIPLTVLIVKTKKLKPVWKVVLLTAFYGSLVLIEVIYRLSA